MVGNVKIRSYGGPHLDGWFTDAITGVTSAVSTWFKGKQGEETTAAYQAALTKQYEQQKQLADLLKITLVGAAVVIGLKAIK